MKQTWNRVLSLLMVLSLIMGLMPGKAFADESIEVTLANGNFENNYGEGWSFVEYSEVNHDSSATDNATNSLNLWLSNDEAKSGSASYTINSLDAGKYYFTYDLLVGSTDDVLIYSITSDKAETALVSGKPNHTGLTTGWSSTDSKNVWNTYTTPYFELDTVCNITFTLLSQSQPVGYWGRLDNLRLFRVTSDEGPSSPNIPDDGYYVSVSPRAASITTGDTVTLEIAIYSDGEIVTNADLSQKQLSLTTWLDYYAENGHGDGQDDAIINNEHGLSVNVTVPSEGKYYLVTELYDGSDDSTWKSITSTLTIITVTTDGEITDPAPNPVEAGINVPYVDGSEDDAFIKGVDVSSLLSVLNSGTRFKNWDGTSLGDNVEAQGAAFMKLLADSGVNWVRLRVWNNPFNVSNHGYGGGNNDLNAAITMGKWATDAGLKVLIDFHYSDFWADPGKQKAPKAWENMTVEQKAAAIENFTKESLNSLITAGVDVGMVQIGNETTNGICGVMYNSDGWEAACKLYSAGASAVRAVEDSTGKDILVAVHFTNPERSGNYENFAAKLYTYNVDYDVFASSYYPYWHGTLENLTSVLKHVADTYGKKVMVAETSWATTLADGDGHDNTVRVGNNDTGNNWPFSVQGQASEVAAVADAVADVGDNGIGLFYWEAAWIPVVNVSGLEGDAYTAQVEANKALWERHGSGWASSYAKEYDPDDAGVWYGGSAVDNQAMFDFDGNPLESLKVWEYMQTGSVASRAVDGVEREFYLSAELGQTVILPASATVTFNDQTTEDVSIVWDSADLSNLALGTHTFTGKVTVNLDGASESYGVTCMVTVINPNLLQNPGFENGNTGYTVSTNWTGKGITSAESTNNHNGNYCLHFYSASNIQSITAEQTVTLQSDTYVFSLYGQGGKVGDNSNIFAYVKYGDAVLSDDIDMTEWQIWDVPEIVFTVSEPMTVTVGVSVTAGAGAWGSFDDWYLGVHTHTLTAVAARDATCTKTGNLAYWKCSGCGVLFADANGDKSVSLDEVTVPVKSHTEEIIPAVAPTYTSTGLTEGKKCSVCGTVLVEQETVPRLTMPATPPATVTPPTEQVVTVMDTDNGSVSVSSQQPATGEVVVITPEPYDGYVVANVVITDSNGNVIDMSRDFAGGVWSFTKPEGNVEVTVIFKSAEPSYTDVDSDDWFAEAVVYAYKNSIMEGVSDTAFAPGSPMTRGMVWAVLARIDCEYVTGNEWLEIAREWAIDTGTSDGSSPNSHVTREQLVTMLYRCAGSPEFGGTLQGYADAGSVSDWAVTAIGWAVENGIMNGIGESTLAPKETATRSQCAAVLERYIERVVNQV